MSQYDMRATLQGRLFRLPRWATPFVLAGAFGVGLLMLLLVASLALVIVPVIVAGGAFAAWRLRREIRRRGGAVATWPPSASAPMPSQDVIDVDYRVIEPHRKPAGGN